MYNWGKYRSQIIVYERSLQVSERNVINYMYLLHVYHYTGEGFGDDIKKIRKDVAYHRYF